VEKDDFREGENNNRANEENEVEKNSSEVELEGKHQVTENVDLHNLKVNSEDNLIILISSEKVQLESTYKIANYNVIIPPLLDSSNIGKYPFNLINSLNIGVSTGIVLNHVKYLQKIAEINQRKELNNI
jgi:hypothetical protein